MPAQWWARCTAFALGGIGQRLTRFFSRHRKDFDQAHGVSGEAGRQRLGNLATDGAR